jgi:NAD-dependent SIR2 family protein deacetylase
VAGLNEKLKRAAEAIRTADALLLCAGAGIGVDSGLPDFRGRQGFWRAYPTIAKLGLSFEEMAHPGWFAKEPSLAWAFYGHRLNLYRAKISVPILSVIVH